MGRIQREKKKTGLRSIVLTNNEPRPQYIS